ncbi:hypothetical protein T484DRAFT_1914160, partial [Baffinella frigidus]
RRRRRRTPRRRSRVAVQLRASWRGWGCGGGRGWGWQSGAHLAQSQGPDARERARREHRAFQDQEQDCSQETHAGLLPAARPPLGYNAIPVQRGAAARQPNARRAGNGGWGRDRRRPCP